MKSDIILAGVGGQGILSIATILGAAALAGGLCLKQAEVHGMSQRGGDVMSCLRLSSSPIASDIIPRGKADLIVSLEPMEALRYLEFLSPEGWIVTNTVPVVNIGNYPECSGLLSMLQQRPRTVAFDMDAVAREVATARAANMVLLGAAIPFIGIPADKIEDGIRRVFDPKGEKIVESNLAAFRGGLNASAAQQS
ncbi:MAG: indolepyruvate oxidoreductase subunit beta [Bacteroidales bacterium]|nr:indolepyruvate oxidoreductase subunit beta [Bacteroidales bacterium]